MSVAAIEVRERLVAFVADVVRPLPLVAAARERACLCARADRAGRSQELAADLVSARRVGGRYQSVQQFLADSPWEPGRLIRPAPSGCAGARRRGLGRRRHRHPQARQALAGGEAPVLGHARQDRQLPDRRQRARGRRAGRCRSAGAVSPRGVVRDLPAGARRRSPTRSVFKTKPQLAGDLCEQAAGWELPAAPILADSRLRRHTAFRSVWHALGARVRASRSPPSTSVYGPETRFAVPSATADAARPRSGRSPRPQSRNRCGARRAAAGAGVADAPISDDTRGRGRLEPLCLRACRRHAPGSQTGIAAALGVADHRMARAAPRHRATTGSPTCAEDEPRERLTRLARLRWTIELDYRQLKGELGLDHYEGRSYRRLPPPHRARHLRARLPHPGAPAPESPAAGLTLPQAVLLLQPVLRCWAGRCRICQQPVDLDQLHTLPPTRVTKSY